MTQWKSIAKKVVPRVGIQLAKKAFGTTTFYARKMASKKLPDKELRLHLGCGDVRLQGFLNVDFLKTRATDIVSDVTKLENFEDGSAALIYACQVVEHFSHE